MTREELQEIKDAVSLLSRVCNSFSTAEVAEVFSQAVRLEHRTLQQSMFRCFVKTMYDWAQDHKKGWYDLRNQATCEASTKFVKLFEDTGGYPPLPYM